MNDRATRVPSLRHAVRVCVFAAITVLVSGGLLTAAVLAPAPAPVLPLVLLVCIGLPMGAGGELPAALRSLRARDRLRRQLARLPETRHPLGL